MKSTENNGWVTLHRKILEWEWYDDINVKVLFIHLLLTVNHHDNKWHGVLILRGQRATGYPSLAREVGLSIRQTRTALTKLKSTGEVTVKSTSKFSIVTVVNYSEYQDYDRQSDRQATVKRQADDSQTTTNNNVTSKQVNKENNITITPAIEKKAIEMYKRVKLTPVEKAFMGDTEDLAEIEADSELESIVKFYNQTFQLSVVSTVGFEKNFYYWREIHTIEKMQKAVLRAYSDKFWKDKLTLTILFRRKNPRGENVDYIEDFSGKVQDAKSNFIVIENGV